MKAILLTLAGVVAGMVTLFLLVILVELFSTVVHPVPSDFGGTKEEMCLHVERYPQWVLAVVVPMWAAAAFIGAWTASKIGGLTAATIVGLLLLAALGCNLWMLPYPMWFKLANLLVMPIALAAGGRLAMPRPAHQAS